MNFVMEKNIVAGIGQDATDRSGAISNLSTSSAAQERFEMEGYVNEVNNLIKDEDWFNIPAPIREACDGVITMTERLA